MVMSRTYFKIVWCSLERNRERNSSGLVTAGDRHEGDRHAGDRHAGDGHAGPLCNGVYFIQFCIV